MAPYGVAEFIPANSPTSKSLEITSPNKALLPLHFSSSSSRLSTSSPCSSHCPYSCFNWSSFTRRSAIISSNWCSNGNNCNSKNTAALEWVMRVPFYVVIYSSNELLLLINSDAGRVALISDFNSTGSNQSHRFLSWLVVGPINRQSITSTSLLVKLVPSLLLI